MKMRNCPAELRLLVSVVRTEVQVSSYNVSGADSKSPWRACHLHTNRRVVLTLRSTDHRQSRIAVADLLSRVLYHVLCEENFI